MPSKRKSTTARSKTKSEGYQPLEQVFLFILVFTLPLIINPFAYNIFAGIKLYLIYAISLILFVLTINRVFTTREIALPDRRLSGLLLAFLAVAFISTLVSIHPKTSVFGEFTRYEGLLSWISYLWLFYMGYTWIVDGKVRERLVYLIALSAIIVSLYGILQYFGMDFASWQVSGGKGPVHRIHSTLGNPSTLGAYLALILPILTIYIKILKKQGSKMLMGFAVLAVIVAELLTLSRGSWLGLIISLCVFSLLYYVWITRESQAASLFSYVNSRFKIHPRPVIIGLICLVMVVSMFFAVPNAKERSLAAFKGEGSVGGRLLLWEQSLNLIKDRPLFGWGPDTFQLAFPRYVRANWEQKYRYDTSQDKQARIAKAILITDNAHNFFIQTAVTFGIVAVALLLAFLIAWFWRCIAWVRVHDKGSRDNKLFMLGIIAGAVGYLTALQFHFSTIHVSPIFWVLLGSGARLASQDKKQFIELRSRKNESLTARFKSIRLLSSVGLIVALGFMLSPVIADIYLKDAMMAAKAGDLDAAVNEFEVAASYNPWEEEYPLTELRFITGALGSSQDQTLLASAEKALHRATDLNPVDTNIYFSQGDFYFAKGSAANDISAFAKAQDVYNTLLTLDPNFTQGYMRLGASCFAQGKLPEAINAWQKAAELLPDSPNPTYNIAYAYEKLDKLDKAVYYYNKTLSIKPNDANAKGALARINSKRSEQPLDSNPAL